MKTILPLPNVVKRISSKRDEIVNLSKQGLIKRVWGTISTDILLPAKTRLFVCLFFALTLVSLYVGVLALSEISESGLSSDAVLSLIFAGFIGYFGVSITRDFASLHIDGMEYSVSSSERGAEVIFERLRLDSPVLITTETLLDERTHVYLGAIIARLIGSDGTAIVSRQQLETIANEQKPETAATLKMGSANADFAITLIRFGQQWNVVEIVDDIIVGAAKSTDQSAFLAKKMSENSSATLVCNEDSMKIAVVGREPSAEGRILDMTASDQGWRVFDPSRDDRESDIVFLCHLHELAEAEITQFHRSREG